MLFSRVWVCVGLVDDLPSAGDVVPVTVAGAPVILVRNPEGNLKAFHNVCRHRGNLLVQKAATGLRKLSCPYHYWTYDLNGHLRATPHFSGLGKHWGGSDFDMEDLCLKPVRLAVWHHWIFACLDDDAPSFEKYAGPMIRHLAGFNFDDLSLDGSNRFEVNANWKLPVENFFDAYHIPYIHRTSLNAINEDLYTNSSDIADSVRTLPFEGSYLPIVLDHPEDYQGIGRALPSLSMPDPVWNNRYSYLHFFPNLFLFLHPNHVVSLIEEPVETRKSRQRMELYFKTAAVVDPSLEPARRELLDFWTKVNDEDIEACETLQLGRQSPSYDGGVFAPNWEVLVLEFQRLVANYTTRDVTRQSERAY